MARVARFLPRHKARILDLGAGEGGVARWLAGQGHRVLAVEPVAGFRGVDGGGVTWCDDRLPHLTRLPTRRFDLILGIGVWHHLTPRDQKLALARCAELLGPRGRVILSLRHGPGPRDRPGYPVSGPALLRGQNLRLVAQLRRPSMQPGNRAAGVRWSWLVLARP